MSTPKARRWRPRPRRCWPISSTPSLNAGMSEISEQADGVHSCNLRQCTRLLDWLASASSSARFRGSRRRPVGGPRGRSSASPRRLGSVNKLACVVANRSGAMDRVTLGCRRRRAARRSILRLTDLCRPGPGSERGRTLPLAVALRSGRARRSSGRHRRGQLPGGCAEPQRVVCAGCAVR